ncbi:Tm-1-like ATP-binding domain-containing protein [Streptomonospora salina]|uniref:Uncharacterized protein (UPF0261 family) n=1 Tax=Streptomonospora salina TaxID=104205 RepID=A0A841EBS5_9ACTN|nr:Tm-1-like ATP-binding domain-containing protein [Streptomonospora salina]MBB5999874.1 uncharacterized protein (UPF0261 family) [Streptomonospora salina]
MAPTVALLGTLDTKGAEYDFLRARIAAAGCTPLLIDCGVFPPAGAVPDIAAAEVARAAGAAVDALREDADRGAAVARMAEGAATTLRGLSERGRVQAALAVGGSGGTAIAAEAMAALPIGTPKLIVSTVASGDTRPYMGARDVAMMYSVVDISGINRFSARILGNAAAAAAGMAGAPVPEPEAAPRPLVGTSMFGVTTPSVTAARENLEHAGFEVLVFHATGTGGQSLEALAADGYLAGIADITTTELADELVGGVMSAGADRLRAAGRLGLPQAVSVGAVDMVNFAAPETVPPGFSDRLFYHHNANVTLMRTTAAECAEIGRRVADRLNGAAGPVSLFLPLGGVSALSVPGGPFYDPGADEALFAALRERVDPARVELHELDTHVNDPRFAAAMTDRLTELLQERHQ